MKEGRRNTSYTEITEGSTEMHGGTGMTRMRLGASTHSRKAESIAFGSGFSALYFCQDIEINSYSMEIHHHGASNSSRPFVILFAFNCLCQISYAQVPAISGFSPSNGPAGTSVILNGSNFSATPDDKIVYFGATRAVVTDASATELTVTVPTGTTYQPISVTLNGSRGYSLSPFVVTFQKNIALDPFSF